MSGAGRGLIRLRQAEQARMRELFGIFEKADRDRDKALKKEEWVEAMRLSGFQLAEEDQDELFRAADKDNDGKISFDEFAGKETKVEKAFKLMDRDGDGYITKAEFSKMCKNLTPQQVDASFLKFDKSGKGRLTYQEFCEMMSSRKNKAATNGKSDNSAVATASNDSSFHNADGVAAGEAAPASAVPVCKTKSL